MLLSDLQLYDNYDYPATDAINIFGLYRNKETYFYFPKNRSQIKRTGKTNAACR